ncbi:uncharacterized protein LOC132169393 [Corylus avellana]|uniref:uncharacterized protein LOC132169393 n=1 Tax=Corylus avellana TaxID=13451 RepID=UPI00286AFE16|nr:uncharacterized protein LOC132169393 [Corylus avellana]
MVERKEEEKKKGRPSLSLSDVRKHTLKGKQQQKRTHSASTCPAVTVPVPALDPSPMRRSTRLNPNPDADESETDEGDTDEIKTGQSEIDADMSKRRIGYMTDKDCVRYREQVCMSGGFDVDPMPHVRAFGLIQPLDISKKTGSEYRTCKIISQTAIDQINKRRERRTVKPQTPLKFVKVSKAMHQCCDLFRYYVTFEAKDVGDGGQTKIFQALARWRSPPFDNFNFSLLSVREYKGEKGDQVIVIHTASELKKRLEDASRTSRLAILFFSKARPCRFISPLYASLSVKYPKVVFLKVDIEEGPNAEGMAVDRGIRRFPTFLFYKSGKEVDKVVGVNAIALKRKIPQHSRKQKQARRKQAKSLSEYEL